jgi:hypothetical protein
MADEQKKPEPAKPDLDRANFLLGIVEKAVKWPKLKAIHDYAMIELEHLAEESAKYNAEVARVLAEREAKAKAELVAKEKEEEKPEPKPEPTRRFTTLPMEDE